MKPRKARIFKTEPMSPRKRDKPLPWDPMAASVLITDSPELADLVAAELEPRVAATKHRERIRTALTGQQSAVLLVRDLDQAVEVADAYAAEHLEIHTAE